MTSASLGTATASELKTASTLTCVEERSSAGSVSEEDDQSRTSYAGYVRSLSSHWRFLQRLDCFMNPSLQVLLKSPLGSEASQDAILGTETRMKKIDVLVLDITASAIPGAEPSKRIAARFNNAIPGSRGGDYDPGVAQALRSFLGTQKSPDTIARLLLVEDLSSDVVEILGSAFRFDPNFFAYQIRRCRTRYVEHSADGRQTREVRLTHPYEGDSAQFSDVASRPYFHLEFRRSYDSRGREREICLPQSVIVRSVELTEEVAHVKEKVSVWMDTDTVTPGEAFTGIFLFDSAMPAPFLSSGAGKGPGILCPDFPNATSEAIAPLNANNTPPSLRTEYIDTLLSHSHHAPEIPSADLKPYLLYFLIARTIAEWSHLADYIERRLVQLEDSFASTTPGPAPPKAPNNNPSGAHNTPTPLDHPTALKHLSFLRRQSQAFRREMLFMTNLIRGRLPAATLTHGSLGADLLRLNQMGKSWETRTAGVHATLVTWLSIQEARVTLEQGEDLRKLTQLGFLFVPVGCVASCFGVGAVGAGGVAVNGRLYWVFVGVAGPVMVGTVLLAWANRRWGGRVGVEGGVGRRWGRRRVEGNGD